MNDSEKIAKLLQQRRLDEAQEKIEQLEEQRDFALHERDRALSPDAPPCFEELRKMTAFDIAQCVAAMRNDSRSILTEEARRVIADCVDAIAGGPVPMRVTYTEIEGSRCSVCGWPLEKSRRKDISELVARVAKLEELHRDELRGGAPRVGAGTRATMPVQQQVKLQRKIKEDFEGDGGRTPTPLDLSPAAAGVRFQVRCVSCSYCFGATAGDVAAERVSCPNCHAVDVVALDSVAGWADGDKS